MRDPFVQSQWEQLCDHLDQVAEHLGEKTHQVAEFRREADAFRHGETPDRYQHLLERVAQATAIAIRWQSASDRHDHDDALVDEASDESFPASDPPVFSHSHA